MRVAFRNEALAFAIAAVLAIGVRSPPAAEASSSNCTLCEDGTDAPSSSFALASGYSCGDAADDASNDSDGNCPAHQATAGAYCGCRNPIASGNARCRICGGDADDLLPDTAAIAYVDENGSDVSCAAAELEANRDDPETCPAYQANYSAACCSETFSCTLCEDGSPPNDPGARFTFNAGETRNCSDLHSVVAPSVDTRYWCDVLQSVGSNLCSCGRELPKANNCTLCEDGVDLPQPNREIFPGLGCAQVLVDAKKDEEGTCRAYQATAGVYCGCNNTAALAYAALSSDGCLICDGSTLRMKLPTTIAYVDDTTGKNVSCGEVELAANKGNTARTCAQTRADFQAACCESTIDLSSFVPKDSAAALSVLWGMATVAALSIALLGKALE